MKRLRETRVGERRGEYGGAGLKFLILLVILGVAGYVGYQFIPVAYNYSLYKQKMQDSVDKAAMTGQTDAWVKEQLKSSEKEYGVPEDAEIGIEKLNGRFQARVRFTRPVVFPGYTYQYEFDHTARSTDLFSTAK
jgi:hypothetical protein